MPDDRWECWQDTEGEFQILPIRDSREHQPDADCWCRPRRAQDRRDIVIHNAADRRETLERQ